jgi:alkylation response protein AidB-like acyl-CoA dehydrogenase
MDFRLTEDQLMFKKMFADFCTKEIRPEGEHIDQAEDPPRSILEKAVDQGFWSALVPEDMDGCGLDVYTYMLMLEELARADMSTALTLSIHNSLVVKPLLDHGTDEQKDAYLGALSFGERLGAFGYSEASAGSDMAGVATTAVREGAEYVLKGSKSWVCNGALAGLLLIFAQVEANDQGPGGLTAFLVENESPGLKVGYREKTLGMRGVACNTVYLDSVRVPVANRLGAEGKGLDIAREAQTLSKLGMAALSLGGSERALEEAVKFSMEHIQFDVPIAQKQAIQNYVADAKSQVEALRALVAHTAWLADTGQPYAQQAAIAKLFGARVAGVVTDTMVQVHGGYGYMKDYAIERYYRDCRALEIVDGTSQIQQFLIARDVYAKEGMEIRP